MKGFAYEIIKKNQERPDHLALIDHGGKRKNRWSKLLQLSLRVASFAIEAKYSGIVPVQMERGLEVLATILGLNLAGVGVAPLSVTTPAARCEWIAEKLGNTLWTGETYEKACAKTDAVSELHLSDLEINGREIPEAVPAYVVFTSGSTGNPKGVMLGNDAVLGGMFRSISPDFFDMNENDRVLQLASLNFIAYAEDCLSPLYAGSQIIVLPEEGRGDIHMITDYDNRFGITCHYLPPQLYRRFDGAPSLKCIVIGSDRVVNLAPKGHRLVNVYGMTEMGGFAFHYDITEAVPNTPIGIPTEDLKAYILDENGCQAEEGEICVSGPVAMGYLDQPELTAATFTPNPFDSDPAHAVLLHSGDIGARIPGGFKYLNRKDNMLKINGQRVEPGEIEVVMTDFEGIDTAVVKGFSDENQHSILCGYYTGSGNIDEEKLREYLSSRLPHYMVPLVFVHLEKMPLNANGKLDRKSLQMPDLSLYQNRYEAPQTKEEQEICAAFAKVLGLERVGRTDDFFRIGGDSIMALEVVKECAALGLSTGDVFAGRTPASIAVLSAGTNAELFADLPVDLDKAPLTGSQMGIFLDCDPNGKSTEYNIPVYMSFPVDESCTEEKLKEAVDLVLKVHPALYSSIEEENGAFFMVRRPFPEGGICRISKEKAQDIKASFVTPIAPAKDALCEATAVLEGKTAHIFLNIHHIVSDGTGVAILYRQLFDALSGNVPDAEKTDAFALSELEKRLYNEGSEAAKLYFEHLLSGVETDSNLIADHKAGEGSRHPAGYVEKEFLIPGLEKLTAGGELTENTFFMGVFGYALAKMTGQEESLFTVAENGRGNAELSDTVSMLVKTLPVYLKIDEEKNASELLTALQAQFFATMRNDCISFEELAKEYGIRSDVMFVYQADMLTGDGTRTMEVCPVGESLSNLSMMIHKTGTGYRLVVEYRKELYEERTIQALTELFLRAAEYFTTDKALKEMTLISEEDCTFLKELNEKGDVGLSDETPVDIIRRMAKRLPDKTAVEFRNRKYTYAQMDDITDRLAAYLNEQGIGRGCVVSVLIPRCEYIVLASLGVLKSGAAYEPLDPSYPVERLNFMVNDAKAGLLIADRGLRHLLAEFNGPVLYTDEIAGLPKAGKLPEAPVPSDLFVLLYTSGTTGTPKGCMLSHSNLRSYVPGYVKELLIKEDSILANYASYGFDAHMADMYPALCSGATLKIIPDEIRLDLPALRDFVVDNSITHLFMTTQVAHQFAVMYPEAGTLETLTCGGEKLVALQAPKYRMMNCYGPTESTCCVTAFHVDSYYENIPIGHPMQNCHIRVLDPFGRQVPVGVPGELVSFGPQVGLGYLGREEQTAKAFVTSDEETGKFRNGYRTGDVVRYLADGNIEYIGRRDMQVKIRGFRIELGEVERAVREYPGIADATVTVLDNGGSKRLCAYVVSDETVDVEKLGSFIAESHPAYMVPSVTMQIDRIPLNVNGKVDKRKLPVPEMHFEDETKPENELQKRIFDKCAEAIGTNAFGIHTDLFMAGLSSIGSIRLCSLLADEFGMNVQIRDLKKHETVAKLEEYVRASMTGAESISGTGDFKKDAAEAPVYEPPRTITKTMEGIFVECIGRPESTVYNIPYLMKLGDGIDEKRLKKALCAAVEAHASMKAELFTDIGGNVLQHRRVNDTFTEEEIRDIRVENMEAILQDPAAMVRPFKLTESRLFELTMIHADSLYLMINIHHIIADGTSMSIFLADVERAYAGEKLQSEKYTAFDLADDERKARNSDDLKDAELYYNTLLDGLDKDFLPIPDKTEASPCASGKLLMAGKLADAEKISRYCRDRKVSLNAFFVSVFGLVLSRFAGTEYSVFNTVYNGRNDSRAANTVGMLVKTLPVVCHAEAETVEELTSKMAAQLMDSMINDLYSYGEISRAQGLRNDVMFIFQGDGFTRTAFCGEPAEEQALALSEAKAAWTLQLVIKEGTIHYELEYDPKRFTEAFARSFVQAYDCAAAGFTEKEKCKDVLLLSEETEGEIECYNRTETPYDRTQTIVSLFENSVRIDPEHLCVSFKDKKYTFGEVEDLTGRLAYFLRKEGIGAGNVVSVLIHRDESMVLCAYGALRTGAAYLGLDPTYPPDRLEFMLKDSGTGYLLADRNLTDLVKNYDGKIFYTDEIEKLPKLTEKERCELSGAEKESITPENDALIIYSSGTTGVPKGSVLQHKAIVCFMDNYGRHYDIGSKSNIATYASFGFDGGAMDVLGAPIRGASLFVIPDEIRMDLPELEKFYTRNAITNGFMTTQVGCMFIAATRCRSLRYFMVGGEKLIPVTGPEGVLFTNGYGPSETMCYVNRFRVASREKLQPIGKVSENIKEYVIDRFGNRQPFGACGEMCISGGQLGRGYLNRPEKTAEVFVTNPFSTDPDYAKMYRTGDIVRLLPDGNYDFVGRRDGQVKIRGFRVELPEVEQQIRKFPGVEKAVVQAFDNPAGGKFLAAYVVSPEALDQEELKKFIASEKPDYMVPAVIVSIDEIPLTSNGKVDVKKLPKPEQGTARKGAVPADEAEEKICHIFEEVLGLQKVYADDDYFAIGGSSISAIQVVVKCEQAGFPVVYKNLFANPTAQKLAAWLRGSRQEDVQAADLEKGDGHDYSALKYNVPENLPKIKDLGVGDVLLTGVTGFLGSHLYKELIDCTDATVICLVRSKEELDAATRFEMIMTYYFEDWYRDSMRSRTVIVDGELEDEGTREKLSGLKFDTIINCAANVKHFAAGDELLKSNFSGVENLISLAEESGAKLIQISSLSVCGESVNGSVPLDYIFRETDLNIGQSLENKYIHSKYLAEQAVIDAVSRGRIRGKIIRLGNLMARASDSEFQVNAGTNGMLRMFMGFRKLGCYPYGMLDAKIEFSPIDAVAKAVRLLSGTPDEFTVFHAKNCNSIHYGYLLAAMRQAGIPVEIVEDDEFERRLQMALKDEKNVEELGGLLAYRNTTESKVSDGAKYTGSDKEKKESRLKVASDTSFTVKALYRLSFAWPLISEEYLDEMINTLIALNFFD